MAKDELTEILVRMGEKKFRAAQVFEWLWKKSVTSFDEMTNLSKEFRSKLNNTLSKSVLKPVVSQFSKDGQTKKILFELSDGKLIETVQMNYEKRITLCVSTQAGCAMGCVFCATGQMGFLRNLTIGEIIGQVSFFSHQTALQGM